MAHVMLFLMWNVLFCNTSTFRIRCACTECGCLRFGFVLFRYVVQVIVTTNTNTTAATNSSPKCVGSLVPDSLPFSFERPFSLLLLMLVWNSRIVHYVQVFQPPGLLFLYFSVYLLRSVCSHLFLCIHFTHPLQILKT